MIEKPFKTQVAECDITSDELTRLRVEIIYGRIPSKAIRQEISAALGVLRNILEEARSV